MIELVVEGEGQLAIAARSAAQTVEVIQLDTSRDSELELILVRYSKSLDPQDFKFEEIRNKNNGPLAMWTDCITDCKHEIWKIMSYGCPDQLVGLQVIRIGAPASHDLVRERRDPTSTVLWTNVMPLAKTKIGSEFFLNFDINDKFVAKIPFTFDNGRITITSNSDTISQHNNLSELPSAKYCVKQNDVGQTSCVLTKT